MDFNLFRDILWHRQHMLQMGSWSGVVVLPAFALSLGFGVDADINDM